MLQWLSQQGCWNKYWSIPFLPWVRLVPVGGKRSISYSILWATHFKLAFSRENKCQGQTVISPNAAKPSGWLSLRLLLSERIQTKHLNTPDISWQWESLLKLLCVCWKVRPKGLCVPSSSTSLSQWGTLTCVWCGFKTLTENTGTSCLVYEVLEQCWTVWRCAMNTRPTDELIPASWALPLPICLPPCLSGTWTPSETTGWLHSPIAHHKFISTIYSCHSSQHYFTHSFPHSTSVSLLALNRPWSLPFITSSQSSRHFLELGLST